MSALFDFSSSPEIPTCLRSEFDTWSAGFDAATVAEKSGAQIVQCPFVGAQAALWQSGYTASKRVTEIGKELAA